MIDEKTASRLLKRTAATLRKAANAAEKGSKLKGKRQLTSILRMNSLMQEVFKDICAHVGVDFDAVVPKMESAFRSSPVKARNASEQGGNA